MPPNWKAGTGARQALQSVDLNVNGKRALDEEAKEPWKKQATKSAPKAKQASTSTTTDRIEPYFPSAVTFKGGTNSSMQSLLSNIWASLLNSIGRKDNLANSTVPLSPVN